MIGIFNMEIPTLKNSNNDSDAQQLDFNAFLESENESTRLALIPYTEYSHLNAKKFTFPKRRFFMLSVLVHLVLAAYALTVVVKEITKTEIIEISYESPAAVPPQQTSYSQPAPLVPTHKTAKVSAPPPQAPKSAPTQSAPPQTAPAAVAEPLATVSDIEIPALTNVEPQETSNNLSLKEIESDFDKIDESHNEKLMAANSADTKLFEDSVSDLEKISQVMADEPSDLENIASERLKNLDAQKAELKKTTLQRDGSPAIDSKMFGSGKTTGVDDSEKPSSVGTEAGIGSASQGIVRKLEDLRQKPGNLRPTYDVTDRMNGLSGTIIINAYVTKEGNLTLFRLIQSTGHRNLDRKSLNALKNWKFYPGQEGWVELPFKWDLKGGVQQKPTLLKRK